MSKKKYDFSGWATVHGVKCSDGRIIHKDAFKANDGKVVPLVWNHDHNDATNVLGHALLENQEKGVYAYCSFNGTEHGKHAKELITHGDICALSIYANKLVQKGSDVTHGLIREVSLVLAGANPGAYIDNIVAHGELSQEEACIYNDQEEIEIIIHADSDENSKDDNKKENPETKPQKQENVKEEDEQHKNESDETLEDVFNTLSEKQKNVAYIMLADAVYGTDLVKEKSDKKKKTSDETEEDDETLEDVFETLSEKQKNVVYIMLAEALDTKSNKEENEKSMKQNAFENQNLENTGGEELTHSELVAVITEAKKGNSLKDCLTEAAISHGISDIENLFPESKLVSAPKAVDVNSDWVAVVMNGVKHTPFARIKSEYFDLTGEDARARGYVKGKQKIEEVIAAVKRTTDPQTVYKLQKFDRDDVVDITDFDVVAWVKVEMRRKLEAELARAFLFGDGRSAMSNDKVDPLHIRPVLTDDAVYSIPVGVAGSTAAEIAENLLDEAVLAQLHYKGSGNITMFVRDDIFTRMLLLKDTNKHRLYKTKDELATAMNVNRVIKVPASIMGSCYALALDLSDYNVGADRGGAVSLFDDFDINYNKMEYLIETRCSGANVVPYSALVFSASTVTPSASSSSAK